MAGMNSPPGALADGTAGAVFVSRGLAVSTLPEAGLGDSPFAELDLAESVLAESTPGAAASLAGPPLDISALRASASGGWTAVGAETDGAGSTVAAPVAAVATALAGCVEPVARAGSVEAATVVGATAALPDFALAAG